MNNKKITNPIILAFMALLLIIIGVLVYLKPSPNQEEEEVVEAFNISREVRISAKKLTLDKGENKTFTIIVTGAVGVIEVEPSNSLVTVTTNNADCKGVKCFYDAFSDNTSIEYVVTGVNSGNSQINIVLSDLLTTEEKEITGSGTIDIVVK